MSPASRSASKSPACPHCHSTDGQCFARTWSCPIEAGGCGDTGPDCSGLTLSDCKVAGHPHAAHVAMVMSAPKPGRALYRFRIAFEGRDVDVVCDGSRVFLLRGRTVSEDITPRIVAAGPEGVDALLMMRDGHASLVRADAIAWGEETAGETQRKADRERVARRIRRAS